MHYWTHQIKVQAKGGEIMLLLFLYNTGARAEEAATLLIRDLSYPRKRAWL